MPNKFRHNFGIRLPQALIAAIEARANTTGLTKTQVVEDILAAHFGLEQATDIVQRMVVVEQRLADVEQRIAGKAHQNNDAPAPRAHRDVALPTQKPESAEGHPAANGARWLTTGQAILLSQSRGWPDNRATLLRWAKEGKLEPFGLRWIPHGSKRNDLATFEDLRHPPD